MFTGLIEDIGVIRSVCRDVDSVAFEIETVLTDIKTNDSISVNGVCLTATAVSDGVFTSTAIAETLKKTTIGSLESNSKVNLERAMRLGDRLGGHFVQGHTDTTGTVVSIHENSQGKELWISFPKEFRKWLIPVGSICVNGASLTVAELEDGIFKVALIPHTLAETTLDLLISGNLVNLEFDPLAKYAESISRFS